MPFLPWTNRHGQVLYRGDLRNITGIWITKNCIQDQCLNVETGFCFGGHGERVSYDEVEEVAFPGPDRRRRCVTACFAMVLRDCGFGHGCFVWYYQAGGAVLGLQALQVWMERFEVRRQGREKTVNMKAPDPDFILDQANRSQKY